MCSVSNGGWGKWGVVCVVSFDSSFLLACGGLSNLFSAKALASFFQKYPRYFEGVPLGYKEFVFNISFDAAHNVAKSCVKRLS